MFTRKFQMVIVFILILAFFVPIPPKVTANASSLLISSNKEVAATNPPAMDSPTVIAAEVSAGEFYTCGLTTGGGVKCWGRNQYGQLGDGTTTNRSTPVDVVGLTSGVSTIAVGYSHTCALTTAGGVKCWGRNSYGELGDGTTSTWRSTPVDVVGLASGVSAVAAGIVHTCALTTSGGVKCWGTNGSGQLGDGTTTSSSTPVDVVGLTSGISAIATGSEHTCALTTTGGVKCWGNNIYGQLGDGTITPQLTPVDVAVLTSGVSAVAADNRHTCALTTSGGVKCWGDNAYGQLGDGTIASRVTPVNVVGLTSGVSAVAAGTEHTCALTTTGGVKCWGNNSSGQLGDGTTITQTTPVDVFGMTNGVSAVSLGYVHTCALTTGGGVKCWGNNNDGQLGDGTLTHPSTPVDVIGLNSGVSAVATGGEHTCALATNGGVKCWGYNDHGQIGDGTTIWRSTPADVAVLASVFSAISAGGGHTCALTSSSGIKCWGLNLYGQLGNSGISDYHLTPVDVFGLSSGVSAVTVGDTHTCALTTSGGVKCWGYNGVGQLGNDSTYDHSSPVDVVGLTNGVSAISAGGSHTCALTTSGGVKCWGSNYSGELGDGTTTSRSIPVDVVGLTNGVSAISAGGSHTCALTTSGGVKCWGNNYYGQLGDSMASDSSTPVDVAGLASGVSAVAAGRSHTCALTTSGGVKCWGDNWIGQLGDGSTTTRSFPMDVVGLSSGVSTVTVGGIHTCALTTSGGVKCWGQNAYGQLGWKVLWVPVDVVGFGGETSPNSLFLPLVIKN